MSWRQNPRTLSLRRASSGPIAAAFATLLLSAACAVDAPTAETPLVEAVGGPALAKPPGCPAQINLTVGGLTGALLSDGSSYIHGVGGVVAHTAAANGNLSFNVQSSNPARTVYVTTTPPGTPAARSTRIYTNNHEQGCGLSGMGSSSIGTAVLEVEWADASNRYSLRYGKNCAGAVGANKITTARSTNVWTLSTVSAVGILCSGRLTGQPNWAPVAGVTAGGFTMTLTG